MSDRPSGAVQRQRQFAGNLPNDFETEVLADHIYDSLRSDQELARLCDAAAAADNAIDVREADDEVEENIRDAWGTLAHSCRQRAGEVIAESCAAVIEDGDEWVEDGHRERDAVDDAQHEAKQWLSYHSNEAERAGVEYGYSEEVSA